VDGFLAQVLQRRRNHHTFQIHRINVQANPELAQRFRIDSTPSICIVEGRRVVLRAHRPRGANELQRALAPWLR